MIREAKGGYHTTRVQRGILIGFLLFLLSEVMLFVSLFWALFHSSLAPNVELAIFRWCELSRLVSEVGEIGISFLVLVTNEPNYLNFLVWVIIISEVK